MPQWLLLLVSLLACAVAAFALLRANRVDAAMRKALASLPVQGAREEVTVTLPDTQGGLSRVALVRFDAFADISGKLSSSAALLDEHGNGLVITTLNGRDSSRNYLKQVRRSVGLTALAPEEADAVARAMGTTKRVT